MYLGYQNGKIKFYTEEILNPNFYQIERSGFTNEEYVYDADLEEYVLNNEEFQARQLQKEKERIAKLTCTKRVFALMLQEVGITYTML